MADKSPHKRQAVLRFDNGKLAGSKRPLVNPQPDDDPARMPLEEIAKEIKLIGSQGIIPLFRSGGGDLYYVKSYDLANPDRNCVR